MLELAWLNQWDEKLARDEHIAKGQPILKLLIRTFQLICLCTCSDSGPDDFWKLRGWIIRSFLVFSVVSLSTSPPEKVAALLPLMGLVRAPVDGRRTSATIFNRVGKLTLHIFKYFFGFVTLSPLVGSERFLSLRPNLYDLKKSSVSDLGLGSSPACVCLGDNPWECLREHPTAALGGSEPHTRHGTGTRQGYCISQPEEAEAVPDIHKLTPVWWKH